jgi:redox-sensitive bicupin YhaK (pirin superfamily)
VNTTIHKADSRGKADYGWLKTRYSFSFANYYDPSRVRFGALRVLNDDWIAGGGGFDTHPHDNMEIVTIMLEGELRHKDSMGHTMVLKPDEVQVMTAGTGIRHSEHNNQKNKPAQLLQLWIYPREKGLKPSYDQKYFDPGLRRNQWQTLVSPDGGDSLRINQDAWFSRATLEKGKELEYSVKSKNSGIFLFVIEGQVTLGNNLLDKRDSAEIIQATGISLTASANSDLLLSEVPLLMD